MSENITPEFGDSERARIREEMRYALTVLQESKLPDRPKSSVDKILGYLSNGFVLLLIGSLITAFLVPLFQRHYENRKQQASLMDESFSQFLLYANSIWQEYYALFPLVQESEIDKDQYNRYVQEISTIKLKRYDAFAKVEALAIVFRSKADQRSDVERALEDYAFQVNGVSAAIDNWLRNLYCAPAKCLTSSRAPVDPEFSPYDGFVSLQEIMQQIQASAAKVSELMVSKIQMSK
jgi:hypothetical protein